MAPQAPREDRPLVHSRPELWDTVLTEAAPPSVDSQVDRVTVLVSEEKVDVDDIWSVGYRLDDRFEIKEIRGGKGSSGMGVVYIVEDDHGNRSAVKTLQRRFRQELQLLQRFVREARTWMLIGNHPNVVCAHRLDIFEAVPCLFMEYVPSNDHGHHALSHRLNQGPLAIAEVLQLAYQFCAGMIHATGAVPGLVHRDIKPDNLLIANDGTLKITDFGLVRTKTISDDTLEKLSASDFFDHLPTDITRIGSIFGTPAYMAPEQFLRASEVTFSADIYGLGCCLYESLTGMPPFLIRGNTTVERLVRIKQQHLTEKAPPIGVTHGGPCPHALERIIFRCLAKHPRDRWSSYQDLSIALLSVMDTLQVEPLPLTCPDPSPRDIADQMRSITLLEGYDQAIHMRKLREGQEESPYAFHLALASYFHCDDDEPEEERQLTKALSFHHEKEGYEAVRRLTELWIRQDHVARAEVVLTAYLKKSPQATEQLLEPLVRVACAQEAYERALEILAPFPDTFRTRLLRVEIYRAQGDSPSLSALLHRMHQSVLDGFVTKITGLDATDTVGWGRADDPVLLTTVLGALLPQLNLDPLKHVSHAVWPNIGGYPDFAPDLAWLSFTLGNLASVTPESDAKQLKNYKEFAAFLGYPSRLEKHLERDEYWFWRQESQTGKRIR